MAIFPFQLRFSFWGENLKYRSQTVISPEWLNVWEWPTTHYKRLLNSFSAFGLPFSYIAPLLSYERLNNKKPPELRIPEMFLTRQIYIFSFRISGNLIGLRHIIYILLELIIFTCVSFTNVYIATTNIYSRVISECAYSNIYPQIRGHSRNFTE